MRIISAPQRLSAVRVFTQTPKEGAYRETPGPRVFIDNVRLRIDAAIRSRHEQLDHVGHRDIDSLGGGLPARVRAAYGAEKFARVERCGLSLLLNPQQL